MTSGFFGREMKKALWAQKRRADVKFSLLEIWFLISEAKIFVNIGIVFGQIPGIPGDTVIPGEVIPVR